MHRLRLAVLMQRASVLQTLQQPSFNNSLKSSLASQGMPRSLYFKRFIHSMLPISSRLAQHGAPASRWHLQRVLGELNAEGEHLSDRECAPDQACRCRPPAWHL